MQLALIFLVCSISTLIIIAGVFRIEDARDGKILLFGAFRSFVDKIVVYVSTKLSSVETYIGKGSLRLTVHYLVHGVLQSALLFVSKIQKKVEYLLRRNKQVAKEIRTDKEKTHLDKIADHKEKVSLTEAQKAKLRSHE